ncbi:hypothetical protein OHA98_20785 [Streptomyces sp. NBC_00654]|uniref:hypothetical protein n=1 Tax=Streptomyces sp. NBC_00654 TaxID=2975799 RepID=UPI0022539DE5|nr:hypothetical protein [Streptomyces sp. NBC_00654]MCX4967172.1 hypothetical protein [Streptomyces sp. NBC_00654]
MRTTARRAFTTLATSAAVVMMATAGASAAPASASASASGTAGVTPATLAPAGAEGWDYIGEFSWATCIDLRDSYAGKAKCVENAGGLYDLYVWV